MQVRGGAGSVGKKGGGVPYQTIMLCFSLSWLAGMSLNSDCFKISLWLLAAGLVTDKRFSILYSLFFAVHRDSCVRMMMACPSS